VRNIPRAINYELQAMSYELRDTTLELQATNYEIQDTSYELGDMRFKSCLHWLMIHTVVWYTPGQCRPAPYIYRTQLNLKLLGCHLQNKVMTSGRFNALL
jgi:hypothetical protein